MRENIAKKSFNSIPIDSRVDKEEPLYNLKNTIPFVPPITGGFVIKVYDGDTITIASKLPHASSPMYRFSVRLDGIDTPEMHGKSNDEKTAARNAQRVLEQMILHKEVTLKNIKTEKYGRILADVYCNNIHINQWMLDNRYAVKYDGGTKSVPSSWLEYQISTTAN
jgi:endonuclease YncB( thermonuclease family)